MVISISNRNSHFIVITSGGAVTFIRFGSKRPIHEIPELIGWKEATRRAQSVIMRNLEIHQNRFGYPKLFEHLNFVRAGAIRPMAAN